MLILRIDLQHDVSAVYRYAIILTSVQDCHAKAQLLFVVSHDHSFSLKEPGAWSIQRMWF